MCKKPPFVMSVGVVVLVDSVVPLNMQRHRQCHSVARDQLLPLLPLSLSNFLLLRQPLDASDVVP